MTGVLAYCNPSCALAPLRPGINVFVPGMSGESLPFYDELQRDPERACGVTFIGIHFPGINHCDYLGLHPTARQRAYFISPSIRSGLKDGRADLMPFDYPGIVRDLEEHVSIDVAVAQVSPPDSRGECSLGASYDFLPSVWHKARTRILHVNPLLPRTRGSFTIKAADCHIAFERPAPIPTLSFDAADDTTQRHAALVASLVRDGDTLQIGVGRLQGAILDSLTNHRRLRMHSGMASSPIIRLIDSGSIAGEASIEAGVVLGDSAFYERVGVDETFYFRPVHETHNILRIAEIEDFCAINSAISVDLLGQVNAENIEGRWMAGSGGMPAFASGARLAKRGRSIVAMPATANGGATSRIIGEAAAGTVITLPRYQADYIVTEYGIADLRACSINERAQALIQIAAPKFQEALLSNWRAIENLI